MKSLGKVVLAVAILTSLVSTSHAVFGDGSLNAPHHAKSRAISKRSVFRLFNLLTRLNHHSRSTSNDTSVSANSAAPTPTSDLSARLEADFARIFNLNREKREALARHGDVRSRRSVPELQSIEGFLKTKQDEFTTALRSFNGAIFNRHQHQPAHNGHPLTGGIGSFLTPFGFQPTQNTVLFLHHDSQKGKNSSSSSNVDSKKGKNATTVSENSTSEKILRGTIVVSTEPATEPDAPPAVVVGQAPTNSSSAAAKLASVIETTSERDRTTEPTTSTTLHIEPRRVTTVVPAEGDSSTTSVGTETSETTQSPTEEVTQPDHTTVRSPTAV